MSDLDLAKLSITRAARALRDKELSALELTDAYLRRIEELVPAKPRGPRLRTGDGVTLAPARARAREIEHHERAQLAREALVEDLARRVRRNAFDGAHDDEGGECQIGHAQLVAVRFEQLLDETDHELSGAGEGPPCAGSTRRPSRH